MLSVTIFFLHNLRKVEGMGVNQSAMFIVCQEFSKPYFRANIIVIN